MRNSGSDQASGEPWLRLDAEGRDLIAHGAAPSAERRDAALLQLEALPGLRRVVDDTGLIVDASPFVWQARIAGPESLVFSGHRPAEIGASAFKARLAEVSTTVTDETRAARGGPPGFLEAAFFAAKRLAALRPGGAATVIDTVISFTGEASNSEQYDAFRSALAAPPRGFTIGAAEVAPPVIGNFGLTVEAFADGRVRLGGFAASESGHRTILEGAKAIAKEGVEDRLQVARGLRDDIDETALIRFTLELAGLLREGQVAFQDGQVAVWGRAVDAQAVREIGDAVRQGRPGGVGAGAVAVTAAPVTPYRLRIQRDEGRVVLTGHLPDAGIRDRVLATLRSRFFSESIQDRSRTAEGAPAGFGEAVAIAIPALATLAAGEVELSDRALQLSGEGLYRESAERLRSTVSGSAPAGWTSTVSILVKGVSERYDAAGCARLFTERVSQRQLRFAPGSSDLTPDFYPVLDAAAELAQHCPEQRLEVAGYGDPSGTPVQGKDLPEYTASLKPAEKPKAAAKDAKDSKKKAAAKPAAKAEPAKDEKVEEPPPEPVLDLAQQRTRAVITYLQQAGVPENRAVAAESGAPERRTLGLALRP